MNGKNRQLANIKRDTIDATERVDLASKLEQILGANYVVTDEEQLRLHSRDFSRTALETAAVMVAPGSTEDVVAITKIASENNFALVPRGGGMSYTLAYAPSSARSIMLDMRRMNRILEINTDDLYITVEPGVTWLQLCNALEGSEFSIPYVGTYSGSRATIGGGLGNFASGLGKGTIADYLLGMEVVLSDGRVITTGGLSTGGSAPLSRHFGPDLTGMFIHDAGAFGVKTRATFRLARRQGGAQYASFGFSTTEAALNCIIELERSNLPLGATIQTFDRSMNNDIGETPVPSKEEAIRSLKMVYRNASGSWQGIKNCLRIMIAGAPKFMAGWEITMNLTVEAFDQKTANRITKAAGRVAKAAGGKRLPASVPIMFHSDPFQPIEKYMVGLEPRCNTPSNIQVPLSRAHEIRKTIEEFFLDRKEKLEKYDIRYGWIVATNCELFFMEPMINWPDSLDPLRLHIIECDERRTQYSQVPDQLEPREFAIELRKQLSELISSLNGQSYQIGKYYNYKGRLLPENRMILEQLKQVLDPGGVMNPGAIGLD